MALVALSVVEQRLDAVRLVLAGATVTEVAVRFGVSRQTLHSWLSRYLAEGVAGLVDRSRRPGSCPHQSSQDVELVVVEMRRKHPSWGAKRIRMQLVKAGAVSVPAERTINRILSRNGLLEHRARKRRRDSFKRWQREAPMQLWQMDIVGGVMIVDANTGELREAKVVTGVDDHSRFCVIAKVVVRATGRAVCLALAEALARFGVPEEILTDNGKQFTARFSHQGGEVLFDRICRQNGIAHRLTAPASPTTTGKVERFHLTLRRDLLNGHQCFESVAHAQAAIDGFVAEYNGDRPHQGLDPTVPVAPTDRFAPVPQQQRAAVPLWLPPTLEPVPDTTVPDSAPEMVGPAPWNGGPVEFDKIVPASGNMWLAHKQIWLGPLRAGLVTRFWVDCQLIHISIGGARVKTLRSHLSTTDLATLVAQGAVPAGPSPAPPIEDGDALEVERIVSNAGLVSLCGRQVLVAERLGGIPVGIRIEDQLLLFFDPTSRELLRTRPNPLSREQALRLRGVRPAGPPPRPSQEPIRVQRRASATGRVMVANQLISIGREHAKQVVEVLVSETTLTIHLEGDDIRVFRRTTDKPVRNIKADRPRTVPSVS